MDRLTKKFPGGYGLVKVKDNEQDIESPYPNTLRAVEVARHYIDVILKGANNERNE